ncbi:MAG TPA: hypothetical protein VF884_03095 [Nitrososphaeraceae archaeon]
MIFFSNPDNVESPREIHLPNNDEILDKELVVTLSAKIGRVPNKPY